MKALIELHNELVEIYGYQLQVAAAINGWRDRVNQMVDNGSGTSPANTMFFGRGPGDPNSPDAEYQYRATFGDLIAASEKFGINSVLHRRYIVVLVAVAWERYRKRIARECNEKCTNAVESAVFGDLTKYRNAILHKSNRLRATPDVLRYFAKGDEVSPTPDQIDSIFRDLTDELNRIGRKYYDTDPGFAFSKRLNEPTQPSKQPERTAT